MRIFLVAGYRVSDLEADDYPFGFRFGMSLEDFLLAVYSENSSRVPFASASCFLLDALSRNVAG